MNSATTIPITDTTYKSPYSPRPKPAIPVTATTPSAVAAYPTPPRSEPATAANSQPPPSLPPPTPQANSQALVTRPTLPGYQQVVAYTKWNRNNRGETPFLSAWSESQNPAAAGEEQPSSLPANQQEQGAAQESLCSFAAVIPESWRSPPLHTAPEDNCIVENRVPFEVLQPQNQHLPMEQRPSLPSLREVLAHVERYQRYKGEMPSMFE